MVKEMETTVNSVCEEYVRELEDSTIDRARGTKDVQPHAKASIESLPAQSKVHNPNLAPTIVRIRLDTESIVRQARNKDDEFAIIAAINRFYIIALLGATDRRYTCSR